MNLYPRAPEILAPAGSTEQLYAAVGSGADAVYMGAADFNARRNAANFTPEAFLAAVDYCKERGVLCNVTLNTLLKDGERDRFLQTLRLIAESGANAVIVQDLAAAEAVRRHCPSLRLHASTQMAVHNLSGVRQLEKLGFSRVVLARELSLKEIAAIARETPLEVEVFVHGAHCMSVSGLCYLSCVLGGRSGNRGLCAQPCRLDFRNGEREYALSLKDMSLLEHLRALAEAGVCSFKIEGRMKRPEYAAAAVTACRAALRGEAYDGETLRRVFSREGFTDGYLTGRRDLSMFGRRQKADVAAAASVLPALQALYREEPKRVGLSMRLTVRRDTPAVLTVGDGTHTVQAAGDVPEPARTKALTPQLCLRALNKLGGTPYFCDAPQVELDDGLMLSAAALNALRRAGIDAIARARTAFSHPFAEAQTPFPPAHAPAAPALRLRFERTAQAFFPPAAERVILPLAVLEKTPALLSAHADVLAAEIPTLVWQPEEEKTLARLIALRRLGLQYAVCENLGAFTLAQRAGLKISGGMHLNILNTAALQAYAALGAEDLTLSFEMNFRDMAQLGGAAKRGLIGYGHLPLMRFRACPAKTERGCGACAGAPTLTDRRGEPFPMLCAQKQYSTLLNPVPLYAGDLPLPPVDFTTLYFTTEAPDVCSAVLSAFEARRPLAGRRTAGLYNRTLL